MEDLKIPATDRTPEIDFRFSDHHLRIKGESYPEDVTSFYQPVLRALDDYLSRLGGAASRVDFELIYFNSSSAKIIMWLLEKLDLAASRGAAIEVHWYYDEEDDTMQELGEEFGEDLEHAGFHLETMSA